LEAISKIWIRFESKARVGKKAEHTREYVSILSRPVTPLSGLRRVFEMASKYIFMEQLFMSETIEGLLERIVFSSEHNHYTVAKIKVRGDPDLVTVVGELAGMTPGQGLKLSGAWETHPKYGRQFRATNYSVSLPSQIHGIQKYLGSGLIPGIGQVMAERLVNRFGEKTLQVIERSPKKLLQVKGIGKKTLKTICTAWEAQREVRDVMIFLQGHGVSTGYSAKIFKHYGQDAIRVVRENPYRLATDIFGIGFLIADGIAGKIGIAKDAMIRAEAGILHVLNKVSDEGHLFLLYDQLLDRAEALLQIDQTALKKAVTNLASSGHIVLEDLQVEDDSSSAASRPSFLCPSKVLAKMPHV